MMNTSTQRIFNRGFSLLEVLFAVVILSVALLATARLHAMVTLDGSYAKARGIAANLAQEKLDDLKSFTVLYNNPDITGDECAAPTYCYSEIGTNTGGQEKTDGSLALISGDITVGNTSYNRTWTVTNYYNCTVASAASTSNCAAPNAKPYPDFKAVTLTVKWADEKGADQTVEMQTAIYASDPASQVHLAASSSGGLPKVSYTPIGVPDGVPVPINTGGTKFKESSKPLPVISGSGDGIEVTFDAITYSGSSGNYNKDAQEEFSTVGCECKFTNTNSGDTPTRKVWNGISLEVQKGTTVTKVAGINLGTNPPNNCDICCRDHHDRASNDAKYDPQRPSSDYTGGDHKHYWYANCVSSGVGAENCTNNNKNTSLALGTPLAEVTSGAYLEACKVMRHDGIWRVMQDWQLRKITILPYSFLSTTTNLNNYVTLVAQVVEKAVKTDSGATANSVTALTGRDLTMTPGDVPIQLLSRAVYVDTIYNAKDDTATTSINEQNTIDSAYYSALLTKITASQAASPANSAWLDYVPFYEANLTKLFDWTSATPTIATVSSEAVSAIVDPTNGYYGNSSRGKVTIQSGNTAGSSIITVKGRLANSGVTGGVNKTTGYVAGVSYGTDLNDTGNTTDTITVNRTATGATHTVAGIVKKGNTSVNLAESSSPITVTATSTSGTLITQCAAQTSDVDLYAWAYSCTVSDGWTGTLSFSSTGLVYTFNGATSTTFTTTLPAVNLATTVTDVVAYGPTASLFGKLFATGQTPTEVAITTSTGQTCSVSSSVVTCANVPLTSGAWTGTVTIANKSVCGSSSTTLCTHKLKVGATITSANDCTTSDGTSAKSTSSLTAGPGDLGSNSSSTATAFTFCAK